MDETTIDVSTVQRCNINLDLFVFCANHFADDDCDDFRIFESMHSNESSEFCPWNVMQKNRLTQETHSYFGSYQLVHQWSADLNANYKDMNCIESKETQLTRPSLVPLLERRSLPQCQTARSSSMPNFCEHVFVFVSELLTPRIRTCIDWLPILTELYCSSDFSIPARCDMIHSNAQRRWVPVTSDNINIV